MSNETHEKESVYYVRDLYRFQGSPNYFYSYQWFKTAKDRNNYLRNREPSSVFLRIETSKGEGHFNAKGHLVAK